MANQSLHNAYSPGDLIGWWGICTTCGMERKTYLLDTVPRERWKLKKDGYMKSHSSTCFQCSLNAGHTIKNVSWRRKLSQQQVLKDLAILRRGGNIDYDLATEKASQEKQLDYEAEEMNNRGMEALRYMHLREANKHKITKRVNG